MPQRGYLWQREWPPEVASAFATASERLDGVVILGGEIAWDAGRPRFIRATVSWDVVARTGKPCGLALRVAPFNGTFDANDAAVRFIVATVASLLADAEHHGVAVAEFQLDFDCPQRKLAGYRLWVKAIAAAVRPRRFVITALPSWLEEAALPALLTEVDGYVLQVHSVPTRREAGHDSLCDPQLARKWVRRAAGLGRPFAVALPTYRCLGGYDDAGKLLGVAMDSVQPAWPAGTRVLEFGADAEAIAALVRDWQAARPSAMNGLIWYRVPTERDTRNWRWPTLAAVMNGRVPRHQVDVVQSGENPIDVALVNNGEAEERLSAPVSVQWRGAGLAASDALPGWNVRASADAAVFTPTSPDGLRLSPGERRDIGWLRYDRTDALQFLPAADTTR
jgi:hypothetical protein